MYAIILGCSTTGLNLAKELLEQGHEITILEKDRTRSDQANDLLGQISIVGDGCQQQVLKSVGLNRADVFIALSGTDEDNLISCQLAKHVFSVPKTIALINNPNNEELFRILGVDVRISSTSLILQHIEEELSASVVHMQALGSSARELVSITIPPDASAVGKRIADLNMPAESLISLIVTKGGNTRFPDEIFELQPNDQALVVTTPEKELEVRRVFTGVD
jgi:trk system potassium uptake protein TrkA